MESPMSQPPNTDQLGPVDWGSVAKYPPLNAQIAKALGWRIWERPGKPGEWFQERDGKPGMIEVMPVLDYVRILRDDLKMHTGTSETA